MVLLVPILLMLGLGVFEVGRAAYSRINVVQAARDGARVAADTTKTVAQVQSTAVDTALPITVNASDVVLCRGRLTNGVCTAIVGAEVSVSVTYRFTTPIPFVARFWGGGELLIQRTSVSRAGS